MLAEVVDADLPLLVGNSSLKKAGAVLHIASSKMQIMGSIVDMKETKSGHFSIHVTVLQSGINNNLPV